MNDNVNHPKHYTSDPSGVECIEITRHRNFNIGNAIKYAFRHKYKGKPLEDLNKCLWYLNDELQELSTDRWFLYPFDCRYEVSSTGKVRNAFTKKIRKPVQIKNGYLTLSFSTEEKPVVRYVHRMVVEAVIGEIPEGMTVAHLDGTRTNNHIRNLEVKSYSRNHQDKHAHGTDSAYERNGSSKLTLDDVLEIRKLHESTDISYPALAKRFSISRAQVCRIVNQVNWIERKPEDVLALEKVIESREGNLKNFFIAIKNNEIEKAVWYIKDEIKRLENVTRHDNDGVKG